MFKKIIVWWNKIHHKPEVIGYTKEQIERAYKLGYNDGKRDGLSIAREQAANSLKEILCQQNKIKNITNSENQR